MEKLLEQLFKSDFYVTMEKSNSTDEKKEFESNDEISKKN